MAFFPMTDGSEMTNLKAVATVRQTTYTRIIETSHCFISVSDGHDIKKTTLID